MPRLRLSSVAAARTPDSLEMPLICSCDDRCRFIYQFLLLVRLQFHP
jgi:hypothetical protein